MIKVMTTMKNVTTAELVAAIGREQAEKLITEFGGRRCRFPKNAAALDYSNSDERARIFKGLFFAGRSAADIGRKYGLTPKRVMEIINDYR